MYQVMVVGMKRTKVDIPKDNSGVGSE